MTGVQNSRKVFDPQIKMSPEGSLNRPRTWQKLSLVKNLFESMEVNQKHMDDVGYGRFG